VKNITVSVDEKTYRRARVKAAASGVSVSRVVGAFLTDYVREDSEFDRLKREEAALRERIADFSGSNRLDRQALHARR
jgi:hypothetical protein